MKTAAGCYHAVPMDEGARPPRKHNYQQVVKRSASGCSSVTSSWRGGP